MQEIVPPEHRHRFFVYVVESPSAMDIFIDRSEGEIIQQAANLNNIPCVVRKAVNSEMFNSALRSGLPLAMQSWPDLVPIIHISAHGNDDGIELTSKEIINWWELRALLVPINQALMNRLVVCMSSCSGYSAHVMALEDDQYPFHVLIGNGGTPTWSETAVAYATFYHLMGAGVRVADCVAGMRAASNNDFFWTRWAKEAREQYLEFVKKAELEKASQALEARSKNEAPGELAAIKQGIQAIAQGIESVK